MLEVENLKPRRFVAIINYAGTSLDPSEQYIRAGMTSVGEAAKTGNGKILANFREIPALSRAIANEKVAMLEEAGIGGVYALGTSVIAHARFSGISPQNIPSQLPAA